MKALPGLLTFHQIERAVGYPVYYDDQLRYYQAVAKAQAEATFEAVKEKLGKIAFLLDET